MSNILPSGLATSLRKQVDISIDAYGVECTLYILTNPNTIAAEDAYSEQADKIFKKYDNIKVWIDWSPNIIHLRKLGLYTENEPLPITARFKNDIDSKIVIESYIKVDMQYMPDQYDEDEFEIINVYVGPIQNIQVVKQWLLAPRRKK